MSSLNDREFDAKMDELLTASVSAGAEPAGLSISPMPPRPRFNWMLAAAIPSGIVLAGVLMYTWIAAQATGNTGTAVPGEDLWRLLSDSLIAGAETLSSTTFLLYAAAIMAGVYLFAANRIIRLCRLR